LKIDIHYKERAILYHNLRNQRFQDVSKDSGQAILERHSARGAAFADIDDDGAMEVLVNNQNESPSLLKLAATPPGHWIDLKLVGTHSNRSAIGARVKLIAGGREQLGEVRSGGSYLSQSDFRLHFGLGASNMIDAIEIRWPSGRQQKLTVQKADRVLTVHEP
jgi:hypothetical protein